MQKDIALVGHSMEVRLYAEDPANYFFPCPGKLSAVQWPSGPGVRIDSGIETGSEISLFYDPLLAKISVWGETRDQALSRMKRALLETRISGVKTNLSFLQAILDHPRFKAGELSTTFVQDEGPFPLPEHDSPSFHAALATAALTLVKRPGRDFQPAPTSPWWKSGLPKPRKVREALQ
jgi:3-methylcrotonyl-CoA carboxylase alpha subunit